MAQREGISLEMCLVPIMLQLQWDECAEYVCTLEGVSIVGFERGRGMVNLTDDECWESGE